MLLKAFLIEMKERKIIEYPEALIQCAQTLMRNSKIINVMVRILFSKTNIYDFITVQESFRVLDSIFSTLYTYKRGLSPTFDSEFFLLGMKICLNDENGLNVAKCLSFLYNQYHMLRGNLRKEIIFDLIIKKKVKKFFFH